MRCNYKILVLIAGCLALSACKKEKTQTARPPELTVNAIRLKAQDIPLSFEYPARAQGAKEVEVRARVGGILLKRNYTEGTRVNAGDVLFEIDPAQYKVALSKAKAQLAQSKAQLLSAQQDWNRISTLFKQRIVSEKSKDDAKSALDSAQAAVQMAQAQVDEAQLNLDYTLVTDPIYVIFSASESEIYSLTSMSEKGLIKTPYTGGDIKAKVKFTSGDIYAQPGDINFINPTIDESTGTIKLRAVFPNPQGRIKPGQFVRLVMEGLIRLNAIVVPQEAVMQGANGSFVYKVNDNGIVEVADITTGLSTSGGGWIVDEGLAPGDVVITSGIMKVRTGMPVKTNIVDEQPAAEAGEDL